MSSPTLVDAAPTQPPPSTSLHTEPLTGAIGAVVEGIELAGPLTQEEVAELRAAVHRHRVVFLRDQHLSMDAHRRLGEHLGALAVSPLHQLLGTGRTMSTIED